MIRTFTIDPNPYDEDVKVFKNKSVAIIEGVTILVGCNGCGKSTLIDFIERDLKKQNIPMIAFNNCKDGGSNAYGELVCKQDYSMLSTLMCSSEGEGIIANICNFAGKIKRLVSSLNERDSECWILFDATDSGLSIDNVIDIKALFNDIIEDIKSKGVTPYIIFAANEYEMCIDNNCLNVQECKYETIKTYDRFKKIVLKTRSQKDKWYKQRKKKNGN